MAIQVAHELLRLAAPVLVDLRADDYVMNYAYLASMYEDEGDLASAEALLRDGLHRNPSAASLLCGLARLNLRKNDPVSARGFSQSCIDANENYLDAWLTAGQVNEALGDFEQAGMCYRRQLEIVPGHQLAGWSLQDLAARARHRRPPERPAGFN